MPRLWLSKSKVTTAEWSFWTTGRPAVPVCLHSATTDRRVPSATFSMEDVPALAGRSFGLADTLVAERAKDIRHQILALESREIGKDGQVFVGVYLTGGNTVSIGLMKHIE